MSVERLTVQVAGRPLPAGAADVLPAALLDDQATDPDAAATVFSRLGHCARSVVVGAPVVDLRPLLGLPLQLTPGAQAQWNRCEQQPDAAALLLPDAMRIALAQQWAQHGAMMLHAAVVHVAGCGVLVLGDSGAGKSTLALSALHAGGAVVSDDWIVLQPQADGLVARRLRRFLSSRPASAELLAHPLVRGLEHSLRLDGRTQLELPDDSAPFPAMCRIDQLWCLDTSADGLRPDQTQFQSLTPTATFVRVLQASVPLLFDARFPAERAALLATVNRLIGCSRRWQVRAGLDVLHQPTALWQRALS